MASKGNYYRRKTRLFMEGKGYIVEYLEIQQRFFDKKRNKTGFVKRDLFGADMLAMNGQEMVFVNSVFGKGGVSEHIKRFNQYPFPPKTNRWIVVWELRAREPDIVFVDS